jgi:hypothetical protein
LALEIQLLLRRLLDRCGLQAHDVFHATASATLGARPDELRNFFAKLTSKPETLIKVVTGRSTHGSHYLAPAASPARPTCAADLTESFGKLSSTLVERGDDVVLRESAEDCVELETRLALLVDPGTTAEARRVSSDRPTVMLHNALARAPIVLRLIESLEREAAKNPHGTRPARLDDLAEAIFPGQKEARRATIELLRLCAAARTGANEFPLVPHRLHLFVRTPEPMAACLNRACTGDGYRWKGLGTVQPLRGDRCQSCGSVILTLFVRRRRATNACNRYPCVDDPR